MVKWIFLLLMGLLILSCDASKDEEDEDEEAEKEKPVLNIDEDEKEKSDESDNDNSEKDSDSEDEDDGFKGGHSYDFDESNASTLNFGVPAQDDLDLLIPSGMVDNEFGDLGFASVDSAGQLALPVPNMSDNVEASLPSSSNLIAAPTTKCDFSTYDGGITAEQKLAHTVYCQRFNIEDENSVNVVNSISKSDERIAEMTEDLSSSRKPLCLIKDPADISGAFDSTIMSELSFPLWLSCIDDLGLTHGSQTDHGWVGLGNKDGVWQLLETQDNIRTRLATVDSNGTTKIFSFGYNDDGTDIWTHQQYLEANKNDGFVIFADAGVDDLFAHQNCGFRAVITQTKIYAESWVDTGAAGYEGVHMGAAHSCKPISETAPWKECRNLSDLFDTTVALSECDTLQSKLTGKPKFTYAGTGKTNANYLKMVQLNANNAYADLWNWKHNDPVTVIKSRIFQPVGNDDDTLFENIIERGLDPLKQENMMSRRCVYEEAKKFTTKEPYDLGFDFYLNCLVGKEEQRFKSIGHRKGIFYALDRRDREGLLARLEKSMVEVYQFVFNTDQENENNSEYGLYHLESDLSDNTLEMTLAGSGLMSDMGCGTHFRLNKDHVYGIGKFSSDDCTTVPVEEFCVDGKTIKRVDMSNCTSSGLNVLSFHTLTTESKSKDDGYLTIDPTKAKELFNTDFTDFSSVNEELQPKDKPIEFVSYVLPLNKVSADGALAKDHCRFGSDKKQDTFAYDYQLDLSSLKSKDQSAVEKAIKAEKPMQIRFVETSKITTIKSTASVAFSGTAKIFVNDSEVGSETLKGAEASYAVTLPKTLTAKDKIKFTASGEASASCGTQGTGAQAYYRGSIQGIELIF